VDILTRRLLDVYLLRSNFATLNLLGDTAMIASMGDVYSNITHIAWCSVYSFRRGLAALLILVEGNAKARTRDGQKKQFPTSSIFISEVFMLVGECCDN